MKDESYQEKLEAVEFAMKCDDGMGAELLSEADLVILGVSRTGKTPLSMHLAREGIKAANIPLIPETDPPPVLKELDPFRIIGLTMTAERLMAIRRERLKLLGLEPSASAYASPERVERELARASDYMKSLGAIAIDVTDMAVEETARIVMEYLRQKEKIKNPGT
ncbi:MAG: kinase/pyrophosphorylase [Aminivibrio sp.]|jgi:regulator of PEP synthase PpsR (kinase-PPPase family)|nr:kinase/pyrophosphorylase [Synergistaceae bacterium]